MKAAAQLILVIACIAIAAVHISRERASEKAAAPAAPPAGDPVRRGEYLVKFGGCTDCHSPKTMTDRGPIDDPARRFSGHPADVILAAPSVPDPGNPWGAATAGMTAWTGPWGVSFASNLTPDAATGIGSWTEEEFVKTLRTGKHRGTGRDILPPMPWQPFADAEEGDLRAIFAYLRSLPPVSNRVPAPLPPAAAR